MVGSRQGVRGAGAVGVAALLLAGCGADTVSGDFSAYYMVTAPLDAERALALAAYSDAGEDNVIPVLLDDASISVDGNPVLLASESDKQNAARGVAEVTRLAPGESYDFVIDLPSQQDITVSVPMVQPIEVTVPSKGSDISADDDLTIAWSGAETEETEMVRLWVDGINASRWVGSRGDFDELGQLGLVRIGEDDIVIPAAEMKALVADLVECAAAASPSQALVFPVELHVAVWRSHRVPMLLPFDENSGASADFEVARTSVLLHATAP